MFSSYFKVSIICSDIISRDELGIEAHQHLYSSEQNIISFHRGQSLHHPSPRISTVHPRNIAVVCTKLGTVLNGELLNIFLTVSLYFLQIIGGSLHVREVLHITGDSNYEPKLFFSQIFFVQNCGHITSSKALCKCRNYRSLINTHNFLSFTDLVEHRKLNDSHQCILALISA